MSSQAWGDRHLTPGILAKYLAPDMELHGFLFFSCR
jgi:hypothetical protein